MLRCWETDAKCRLCFNEIVTELNKLISCDSGYFVLENESVSHADGYITVNPTKTPGNHYDTHEADLTTPDDHRIDATDTDVITTPDDGTMITDADDTETHDDYTNPTMTHDYINTGIISDDYSNPGLNADDYISPIVMRNADTAVAPDNDYVNV